MAKDMDMYIVEALHEIPTLADRIEKNKRALREYSSGVSNMTPQFKTEAEQKKQVAALLQSTIDLANRFLRIKRCIAFTNAMTIVEIDGYKYSITELIAILQQGGRNTRPVSYLVNETYDSLCDMAGKAMFDKVGKLSSGEDAPKVVLYYDEAKKNKDRDKWYEFTRKITSTLEVFNARTKLMDPEDYEITLKVQ